MENCNDEDDIAEVSPDKRYIRYSEILARGAFKIVYKGFDEGDGIEVAWNQVSIDEALKCPGSLEKLRSELHLLKTLKHENIIKSYVSWVDREKKTINLITELFTSGSLRQYRNKHRTVDVKAIKNWARQILRGLHYLHSHNPPIIHRDLKCDNIFINGNHGDVKIGTPELMAPELINDGGYNELVDIYSFGMCMLELATCQSPSGELKNAAQIFEEATSGVKPAALSKVKDPLIKQFIERCLIPSQRLSAAELLNDPFLSSGSSNEVLCASSSHKSNATPKVDNLPSFGHISMEVDPKPQNVPRENIAESMKSTSQLSFPEIQRHNIRLSGEKEDSDSVLITLIIPVKGEVQRIEFTFNLLEDTALSIAVELAKEFKLPKSDTAIIFEMISDLLLKVMPSFKPSVGTSGAANSHEDPLPTSSALNQESSGISTEALDAARSSITGANNFGECSKEIIPYDSASGDTSSNISSSSVIEGSNECDDLMKLELDATEVQYQGRCRDLMKQRQEDTENLKRRWMTKQKFSPVSCI